MSLIFPKPPSVSTLASPDDFRVPNTVDPILVSLAPGAYNAFQDIGWTISQAGNALRLAWDGSGSKVWNSTTETGLCLILPGISVDFNALNAFEFFSRLFLEYDDPTVDAIGVGVGWVNSQTVPTQFVSIQGVRSSAGNQDVLMNSDVQDNTIASGASREGGLAYAQTLERRLSIGVAYDPSSLPQQFLQILQRSGSFRNWSTTTVYPAIFGMGGGSAGSVDITKFAHVVRGSGTP